MKSVDPKPWSERHHYETDDDNPLDAAGGIWEAMGWCLGYGALLIFIAWAGKQMWVMYG